ncbi:RNA polymerase II elongation factor ELL2-like [Mya arenaria]|uniref:RNA polymerase II elongation factor ELL2-like n=1 Tax=Mya arenaria TaxID=6604 RepID=UPI0022E4BD3B|nr:RNA polymerase II elongation factor ELL2-like [Mya arenaria]
MAALEEGFQYGLSSKSISSSNKSVVQVKLTDSALRIFEEYVKRKPAHCQKPSIQFDESSGAIQIPDGNGTRTFKFTLSALEPNGSFDAIRQPQTRGGQLTLEGSMTNKIQIHATSELFETTRERVTQAEIDSKKNSTKVIKQSGPRISRKKTTVIRNSAPTHQPSRPPPAQPVKPKPPSSAPVNFVKRPSPSYATQGHAVSPHNPTSAKTVSPTPVSQPSGHASQPIGHTSQSSVHTSQSSGHPSQPSGHPSQPAAQSTGRTAGNSAITAMPYRDRIIHLLAIHSYKRPELLIRLRKDGENKKDKDQLGAILNQVAVAKDNVFSLAKYLYTAEVRSDWPFYTEEDRQILKKKMASLSSVSPSASPANRSPDSQSSTVQKKPESLKRSLEDSNRSTHHSSKKIRISHCTKKESRPSTEERLSHSHNSVSSTTDISDKKENIDDTVDSTSDTPEYMREYFMITSDDQRSKYKQDFNVEYDEYRELHSQIDKVSQKFINLEMKRKKYHKNTIEYKNIEDAIRTEYRNQKSDIKFLERKKHFEYLHKKLAHIKKLITDYDQKFVELS